MRTPNCPLSVFFRRCMVAALALLAGGASAVEVKVVDPLTIMYDRDRVIETITTNIRALTELTRLDQFDALYTSLDALEDEGTVRMVGPRNGRCSGQVVVWGEGASEVEVSLDGLRSGEHALPADAVEIRYLGNVGLDAMKDVRSQTHPDNHFFNRWYNVSYYDVLHTAPPPGADLLPVWVTVSIPADAAPGLYRGTLAVGARKVPVELTVSPWACPSPADFTVHMAHILQSPETLAMHYGVPMWSDEHMALVEKSLHYMGLLGNRSLVVTAQHRTHLGNEQAMVPFRDRDGRFVPDFTVMNRYLDAYEKHVRTPQFITLYMWSSDPRLRGRRRAAASAVLTKIVDGEPQEWQVPFHEPESEPVLRALLEGFRTQMVERGWADTQILIGMADDNVPDEKTTALLKRLAPWAKWCRFSHYRGDVRPTVDQESYTLYGHLDIGFAEEAFTPGRPHGGWDMKFPRVTIMRRWITEYTPLTQFRWAASVSVGGLPPKPYGQESMTGICRWGLDYWNVDNGSPLLLKHTFGRWGLMYRPVSIKKLLGPAPDGPVATTRLEMFLEGIQETEARIVLEKALRRDDVPEALKDECRQMLDQRLNSRTRNGRVNMGADYKGEDRENEIFTRLWGVAEDWRAETAALFELAARAGR